jgi:parallel beta-helix repeat protein
MKRAPVAAVVVLGVVLLAGCAGRIDSVTNVTQVSATVNATLSCSRGEAGQYWAEYRRSSGGGWTQVSRRSYNCSTSASEQRAYQLTGLSPGTGYQVRLCYDPAPIDGGQVCGDRSGTVNGTNYATFTTNSATASGTCDRSAAPSTFASQVSAAAAGQTICLGSGNYGTWAGASKAITIKAAGGATPSMKVNFNTGDGGFTLDGMSGMGGDIANGAGNITIRNSSFTSPIIIRDTACGSNILLDGNVHRNLSTPTISGVVSRVQGWGAFTIQNSLLEGGDMDGVRIDSDCIRVVNNTFRNILQNGPNHTDNIQFYGGGGAVIRGNWFVQTADVDARSTQVLAAYDGTENNLIEDNVIDSRSRPWGIELYSDTNSIVRHNTVIYRPGCDFNIACGYIDISRKVGTNSPNGCPRDCDPGVGTQVYDNVANVIVRNGSTVARNDHNVPGQQVSFVGPLDRYDGFRLAAGSPGKGAASDGSDVGVR